MDLLILFVYLIDVLDSVRHGLGGLVIILLVVGLLSLAMFIASSIMGDDDAPIPAKAIKKSLTICFISMLLAFSIKSLIPSKETMYIMAGLKATGAALETPIAKKAFVLVEKKLDEAIDEIAKEKGTSKETQSASAVQTASEVNK